MKSLARPRKDAIILRERSGTKQDTYPTLHGPAEQIDNNGRSKTLGPRRIPANQLPVNAAMLVGHSAGNCLIAPSSFAFSLLSLDLEGDPGVGFDACPGRPQGAAPTVLYFAGGPGIGCGACQTAEYEV